MKKYTLLLLAFTLSLTGYAQQPLDSLLPVRGLCIAAPAPASIPRFVQFVDSVLGPKHLNVLILRVDFRYQYQSHPELVDSGALSESDVKQLVEACRRHDIRLVPQVNLLGHQSWASELGKLLEVYPQFDETPHIKIPETYVWPNEDGLYCKSYCPRHPDVHDVVFDLVDEITEVFEADAFHAGMDEVFYIGNEKCPRCGGRNKAELFADEVTTIRNHLAEKNKQLWIWGDRLIDGKTTGIGMWEASMNNTYPAIDLIPKDILICDWHYERADPTAAYFATKGFDVVTCPWRQEDVALNQLAQMLAYRDQATPVMKERFRGMIHTVWTDADSFMDVYYGDKKNEDPQGNQVACFNALFDEIADLNQ